MGYRILAGRRGWIGSTLLIGTLLTHRRRLAILEDLIASRVECGGANQPEPMEAVTAAVAVAPCLPPYRQPSIGTVLALRSITLQNELAGTVRRVALTPGAGRRAGRAPGRPRRLRRGGRAGGPEGAGSAGADHARPRLETLSSHDAVSAGGGGPGARRARRRPGAGRPDPGDHRAQDDPGAVPRPRRHRRRAPGPVPRTRAPQLTTLQGVDDGSHVDFTVAQTVAAGLRVGDDGRGVPPATTAAGRPPRIVAIDARVDPTTRNAMVRARGRGRAELPRPAPRCGCRCRSGRRATAVAVPVSALRKGPGGDHVFVIAPDQGRQAARPAAAGAGRPGARATSR